MKKTFSVHVFFEGAISMAAHKDGCFLIKKRLYFSPQAKYLPIWHVEIGIYMRLYV